MSYEAQDVVQEAPTAKSTQGGSLHSEAYGLMNQQFTSDASQASARNAVNQTFGSLELFGDDVAVANQAKTESKPAGGRVEKIDAAVTTNDDGSTVLEFKNGDKTSVSKDDKVTEFDKNGKEIKDAPAVPAQLSPEDLKKAVDDLLNGLPNFEDFNKRNVPRNDGIIRQRDEIDSSGNLAKVTEYPNGVSISKTESNIRGEDGKLHHEEKVVTKFPEGVTQSPDGTVLDKTGKPIFKDNADGSKTIFMNDANGKPQTVTEFPNGVRITKGEPETIEKDGHKITIDGGRTVVFPDGAAQRPDGTVVDKSGKPLTKDNPDGSITVFSDDGTYTQSADGKVTFKKAPPKVK